jgi:alkylation response protein AidB-like acyl-CoA dehydrogenase
VAGPDQGRNGRSAHWLAAGGRSEQIFTIFEGTSEIQRLVISRNISGLRIE